MRDGKLALPATPDGEQSAIGAAMNDALDRESSGRVLAMLLLSDGAQRAMPPRDLPPQVAVRRLAAENIPLYTFTFGKSGGSERADLAIDDLVTNETIFTETPTEVRGQLTAQGYANQQVKVQLLWEKDGKMEVVDTAQVDTGAEGGSVPVALHHTPRAAGRIQGDAPRRAARRRAGDDEQRSQHVCHGARPAGSTCCIWSGAKRIGGGPGPEQRFVRAALAQSPDIVVERRLINYDPPGVGSGATRSATAKSRRR